VRSSDAFHSASSVPAFTSSKDQAEKFLSLFLKCSSLVNRRLSPLQNSAKPKKFKIAHRFPFEPIEIAQLIGAKETFSRIEAAPERSI